MLSKLLKYFFKPSHSSPLDYDKLHLLDAENLAEEGSGDPYKRLLPELNKYLDNPAALSEQRDPDIPFYKVQCNGDEFLIYSGDLAESEAESWSRATFCLFSVINKQLAHRGTRFNAIDSGNDLGGMFLTEEEAMRVHKSLSRKSDWPYIPMAEVPWERCAK